MELRQLRYFIKVVEHGGLDRAAAELGMVTSALSQQISRLESELATRLLTRTATGVVPTDAGIDDFLHRPNLLASLSDDELSPAALAVRVLLAQVAADLVTDGHWPGPPFTNREAPLHVARWLGPGRVSTV